MAIGLNSLLLENTSLSSNMDNVVDDECYTLKTFSYLRNMNEEFREANKEFYRAVYEADTLTAVNESFGDFFVKIKDIIVKFLKYIKSLFDRFNTALHKIVGSKKYILKNEETLKKFNSSCEFDYDGFEFTISPNIPVCNAVADFNTDLFKIDFKQLESRGTNADKKEYVKNLVDQLKYELDHDKYDQIRAQVIGKEGSIYQSEYGNELFQVFRDGSDSTSLFTVNSAKVTECLNSFKNYEKDKKDALDKKREIEKEYNNLEKQIDSVVKANRNNNLYDLDINSTFENKPSKQLQVDNDTMNQINLYVKALLNQVTEMTTIHSMAFSYKLDAIKDKYNQDKRILYIALSKVQKDKDIRNGGAV